MTFDEAIKLCMEIAEVHDKLSKRCDDASGYSRSHNEAIRTNDAKEFEKCSQDFRQLAEWMRELKAYKEQELCSDAINRKAAVVQLYHNKTGDDDIDVIIEKDIATIQTLPPVTPKQKTGEWIELKDHKPEAYEDVLVRDIDGDVTCAYLCDDTDFLERFSGEIIDDVVEWMEMPG